MRIRPTYIRTRLTLWYIAIFSLIMGLYVSAACAFQYWELNDQLYHAEVQDMETVEGLLYFNPDGRLLLHEEYHSHPGSRLLLDRFMEVLDPKGNVLFRNEKLNGLALGGPPLPQESRVSHFAARMRLADGRHVLVVSHYHPVQGKRVLIRLAYDTEPLKRRLIELLARADSGVAPGADCGGFRRISGRRKGAQPAYRDDQFNRADHRDPVEQSHSGRKSQR